MSGADPMADIHLALNCPSCEHKWEAPFDIVAFLWREISAAARRLLREVHTLASAYGWTETEILALSPARRRDLSGDRKRMSDFLSNLIARSFTDAPVIQPRVPSLFETTGDEFLDEPQSSTAAVPAAETIAPKDAPAPVSKLSPTRETATTKSIANVSDATAEEHLSKPASPAAQNAPVIAQTSRLTSRRPN